MMHKHKNVYYSPEAFGLTIVADADAGEMYEFDMFVIWVDASGTYWWDSDAGCSCPTPFDDMNLENMPSGRLRDALVDLDAWANANEWAKKRRIPACDTDEIRALRARATRE